MNKVIVFLLITIFFSSFATSRYIADYDSRDLNQTIYNPTETIGITATAYGANPIVVRTINNVIPSYSNIDLVSDGNITIDGNSENSTIKIGLNADVNFSTINIIDLNGNDANFINIGAERFFGGSFYGIFIGDGSGLTGIPTDINSHFVPYIDAIADMNLGIYNLTANDLNSINLGVESNTHLLGNVYAPFIQTGMDGPTGFPNKCSDVIISFTDGTNTFSIQPSGASFSVFHSGIEFVKTAEETLVTTDDEGAHYIYYDETGTLQENVTPSNSELQDIIRDEAEVAILYWNTTADQNIYFTGTNECHGTKMDGATHAHQHFTRGTLFESGLAVGDITADDTGDNDLHAQISLTNGSIRDEDIIQTITDDSPQNLSIPANLPIFYRSGASNWRKIVATNFPITTTGTGRAAWNEFTGGAWQLSEVGNTDFVLSHIFATNNFYEPIVVLVGQADYATQTAAREGAATEVNNLITSGLGFQEFVPIATIIFQTNNGYSNAVKSRIRTTDTGDDYIDWRFTQLSPSVSPSDHGNLAGLADDDHDQYALSAGDTITGDLNINQDLNVGQDLNVLGNVGISGNIFGLNALGDSNFGNIGVSENQYITGKSFFYDDVNFGSNDIIRVGTINFEGDLQGWSEPFQMKIGAGLTGFQLYTTENRTVLDFVPVLDGGGVTDYDLGSWARRFSNLFLAEELHVVGDINAVSDINVLRNAQVQNDLNVWGGISVVDDSNFGNVGISGTLFGDTEHSLDNSQAHTDYLLNNADDTTTGDLTIQKAGASFLKVQSPSGTLNPYLQLGRVTDTANTDFKIQNTGGILYFYHGMDAPNPNAWHSHPIMTISYNNLVSTSDTVNFHVTDGSICVEDSGGDDCSGSTDGFVYADDYIEHTSFWDVATYGSALEEIRKHEGSIVNDKAVIEYDTFSEPIKVKGFIFSEELREMRDVNYPGLSQEEFYEILTKEQQAYANVGYGISIGARAAAVEAAAVELGELVNALQSENQALKEALCRYHPEDMICK